MKTKTREKIYSIAEISKLTGISVSAIIRHAEQKGIEKLGIGRTSAYLCPEWFYHHIQKNVTQRVSRAEVNK
jgi:hypothetical protein